MTLYETTFIVNPQTDDATIESQVKAITDIITTAGGKIVYENLMGTRRMAYPIKKLSQGYYANFIFEAPKTVVEQINYHIRMNEAYLRHMTIIYDGQIPDKNAPPMMEDDRSFGRPRGDHSDRPYGRREGGRDGYRDRGRPERDEGRPERTEPRRVAPAPVPAPAKPEPDVAPEVAPETPVAAVPTPEPAKVVDPPPTPAPAPVEPKPEPTPPPAPPKPAPTEDYREDEEL
jgi:small subunit ribosomal protein S6